MTSDARRISRMHIRERSTRGIRAGAMDPSGRATRASVVTRLGVPVAIALACAALTGCQSTPGAEGQSQTPSEYSVRTLDSRLAGEVTVSAVMAAGDAVLRDRGYTVTGSTQTASRGRLTARAPNAGWFERIVLEAKGEPVGAGDRAGKGGAGGGGGGGVAISVTVEPLGDQAVSRSILDEILRRLGR